jgi:hypothetical protein
MAYRAHLQDAFDDIADRFNVPLTAEQAEIAQEVADAEIDAKCEGMAADVISNEKHAFRFNLDDYLGDNGDAIKVALRMAQKGDADAAYQQLRTICQDWQRYFVGTLRDDAIEYMRERGEL